MTLALLLVLLSNLLLVGLVSPPDLLDGDLPMASRCQGGGPGCVEQPMIPPPAVGLPRFDMPADPVFGAPVLVHAAPLASRDDPPLISSERPPALTIA